MKIENSKTYCLLLFLFLFLFCLFVCFCFCLCFCFCFVFSGLSVLFPGGVLFFWGSCPLCSGRCLSRKALPACSRESGGGIIPRPPCCAACRDPSYCGCSAGLIRPWAWPRRSPARRFPRTWRPRWVAALRRGCVRRRPALGRRRRWAAAHRRGCVRRRR